MSREGREGGRWGEGQGERDEGRGTGERDKGRGMRRRERDEVGTRAIKGKPPEGAREEGNWRKLAG